MSDKKLTPKERTDKFLRGTIFGTLIVICAFVGNYAFHFFGRPISNSTETWGQFGDYIGGTLNPILSLFGLLALLYTIKMQGEELELSRSELELTRNELHESRKAQQDQAVQLLKAAKITAIQSKISMFDDISIRGNPHQYSRAIYGEDAHNILASLLAELDDLTGSGKTMSTFPNLDIGFNYVVKDYQRDVLSIYITPLQLTNGGSEIRCRIHCPMNTSVVLEQSPTGPHEEETYQLQFGEKFPIEHIVPGTIFRIYSNLASQGTISITVGKPAPLEPLPTLPS